jgi:hypothetical protein
MMQGFVAGKVRCDAMLGSCLDAAVLDACFADG